MARIRTIKPEFFRHELLQELECLHPGKYPMLVFEGLWVVSDKNGNFEWKPKQLKLDILPFIPFDINETLSILQSSKLIVLYEVEGTQYGNIPTFSTHQRISGSEATNNPRYPSIDQGSIKEASRKQFGKTEREREKERERKGARTAPNQFPITENLREWAKSNSIMVNLESETEKFLDHHKAKGSLFRDWTAAWRKWIRQANDWSAKPTTEQISVLKPDGCPVGYHWEYDDNGNKTKFVKEIQ